MKIAVVQHRLRPAPAQDLEALVLASVEAAAQGAEAIILPEVPAIHDGPLGEDLFRRVEASSPGLAVFVAHADQPGWEAPCVTDVEPFGPTVLLPGDACMDADVLASVSAAAPVLAVLAPRSESELQAQAVLELAIGLSTSLASVIVISEPDGAEVGDPGHGGSAIVHLGQVLAEAMSGDDLLVVDIATPLVRPEAPEGLPSIPPVLTQRIAAHQGRKLAVDYPADLR